MKLPHWMDLHLMRNVMNAAEKEITDRGYFNKSIRKLYKVPTRLMNLQSEQEKWFSTLNNPSSFVDIV